jgi:hypothetical protein
MSKYHVSPATGNPGPCKAIKACPFGGASDHYDSPEEARDAYEAKQMQHITSKKTNTSVEPGEFDYSSNDLNDYLKTVKGVNVIYRKKMYNALNSDNNEMARLKSVYDDTLEADQGRNALMTEEFKDGFTRLYNNNVTTDQQIGVRPEPHGNSYLNEKIDANADRIKKHFPAGTSESRLRALMTPTDNEYQESRLATLIEYTNNTPEASWKNVMGANSRMTNANEKRYYDAVVERMSDEDRDQFEKNVADHVSRQMITNMPAKAYENNVPVNQDVDDYFDSQWSKGTAEKNLDSVVAMQKQLAEGTITPGKIVGSGYKNPKKVAQRYLDRLEREGRRELATRGRSNSILRMKFQLEKL